ncbi:MAG: hypothetical protein HY778_17510 [Betaproteobacteria bacterium]|nr:hypothetical protein [Betaproteobacteria bacterium]
MKHKTALALTLAATLLASAAHAEDWSGRDKVLHFGVSIPLGVAGAVIAQEVAPAQNRVLLGTLIGSTPALAKELYDSRSGGSGFSGKDLAVSVAGAALGAWLGDRFLLAPVMDKGKVSGVEVRYARAF